MADHGVGRVTPRQAQLSKRPVAKGRSVEIARTSERRRAHFAGSSALVTGAGFGIGLALATELVARGADVMVTDLDGEAAAALADELRRPVSCSERTVRRGARRGRLCPARRGRPDGRRGGRRPVHPRARRSRLHLQQRRHRRRRSGRVARRRPLAQGRGREPLRRRARCRRRLPAHGRTASRPHREHRLVGRPPTEPAPCSLFPHQARRRRAERRAPVGGGSPRRPGERGVSRAHRDAASRQGQRRRPTGYARTSTSGPRSARSWASPTRRHRWRSTC